MEQTVPATAIAPHGAAFPYYREKISDISFFDFAVKVNRMLSELLPVDSDDREEMKAISGRMFVAHGDSRLHFSASFDEVYLSFNIETKEGGPA